MKYADDDIRRFLQAQEGGIYDEALVELRAGMKTGHWMWFVFPQVRGLGFSWMADHYGIGSWEEAEDFLVHEALGPRITEAARGLLALDGNDPVAIPGDIDAMKLRSSMTLFEQIAGDSVFVQNGHIAEEDADRALELRKL